jgi:hypothetical protein
MDPRTVESVVRAKPKFRLNATGAAWIISRGDSATRGHAYVLNHHQSSHQLPSTAYIYGPHCPVTHAGVFSDKDLPVECGSVTKLPRAAYASGMRSGR